MFTFTISDLQLSTLSQSMLKRLAGVVVVFLLPGAACIAQPLPEGHAHNDYLHRRPLLDALDHGFSSVEADVHLVRGQLLVAHDLLLVKPDRTLQALYLDPLRERLKKNGGRVYPAGPEFTLLVELKTDWKTTYPVLSRILEQYADMLTVFRAGKKEPGAVAVIITGHRAQEMFAGEPVRCASLDGSLASLDSTAPADLVPWISSDWKQSFGWRGVGPFPDSERSRLKDIVARAHHQGRKVRFWGAPDHPAFWRELLANKVDLINTDDLDGAREFLLSEARQRTPKDAKGSF